MQPTTTSTATPTTQTNTDPSQFGNYSNWAQQEMAKGFSAQQLQQTLSSSNITPQASQPNAPAQTGSSPNFLERLLPTAGGVVGGILGDLLPGGPITGIAGAGAGDALGKSLEDKLTGQGGGNGVLGAAISGGVGQGVGSALSGLAGAALGKVSGLASKAIPSLLVKQSGDFLDQDTAKYLAQNGISDFGAATKIGQQLTGATGGDGAALSNAVKNAADNSSAKLDLTDEAKNWTTPLQNYPDVHGTPLTNISKTVNQVINKAASDSGANISRIAEKGGTETTALEPGALKNITPGAAYEASQTLRRAASSVGNGARDATGTVVNSAKAAAADTYNNLASSIEQKALGTGIDGSTAVPISPEDKQVVKDSIAGLANTNPTLHQTLSNQIDAANSWQDIRSIQQPFVKVSQAKNALDIASNKAPGTGASDIAKGTLGVASNPLQAGANIALNSGAADKVGAKGLAALSKVTGKAAASKIIPLLTRTAAIGATNLPNDVSQPQSGASAIPGTANGINSNSTGSSTMQPQQQSPLQQLYSAVLAQEQAPGASLTPGYSAMNSTLSTLAPQVQKQQLEAPAISNAVSGFANAGGAQGTGAGILSKLSGLIPGTAANTYNSQQSSAASALAQLLGISPESAMSLLPQLTQSTQTAAPQMGGLSSILGSLPTATAQ